MMSMRIAALVLVFLLASVPASFVARYGTPLDAQEQRAGKVYRIGFLRATGRHAAKYLSALPCFLGFIMALFSSRGLAFHDRLSGTRVVKD